MKILLYPVQVIVAAIGLLFIAHGHVIAQTCKRTTLAALLCFIVATIAHLSFVTYSAHRHGDTLNDTVPIIISEANQLLLDTETAIKAFLR